MIVVSEKAPLDGSSLADSKKNDGLGRIRTGDLRHVKADDLAFILAFSDSSAPFSVAAPLETTTRKASAPSCTV